MCIEQCGSLGLSRCSHELAAERESSNVTAISDGKWQRNGRRLVLASAVLTGSIGLVGAAQVAAAECEDTDGDGWGWDGSASCIMEESEVGAADSDDQAGQDIDFAGNFASLEDDANGQDEAPCVDSAPLNDGWGWDGSASCRLPIEAGPCIDSAPLNDGWGWDGVESCRLMEIPSAQDDDYDRPYFDVGEGIGYDTSHFVELSGFEASQFKTSNFPDALVKEEVNDNDSYEARCNAEFGDVVHGSCLVCADPFIFDLFSPWEGPNGDTYVDNRAMECFHIDV